MADLQRGFDEFDAAELLEGAVRENATSIIVDPETGRSAFAESAECVSTGFTSPFGDISDDVMTPVLEDALPPAVQASLF